MYVLDGTASFVLTLSLHSHGQALLVAAVLAAVPLAFVHQTVLTVSACVAQVLPHSALEKALAALAAVHAVVLAWRKKTKLRRWKTLSNFCSV